MPDIVGDIWQYSKTYIKWPLKNSLNKDLDDKMVV